MRELISAELDKYLKYGKAYEYLLDAIELYDVKSGDTLKRVYGQVASAHRVTTEAVARCIALAVSNLADDNGITAKAFIARIKERIMFEIDE